MDAAQRSPFSGLEIWELIATWKEAGESWDALREVFTEEDFRQDRTPALVVSGRHDSWGALAENVKGGY